MSVNRYSRRNIYNQFRPVQLQEFLAAPMAAQQIHNQALESALANRTDISALPWHEKERLRITGEMDSAIDSVANEIGEKGVLDMPVSRKLIELREKKRQLFGPGSRGEEITQALQKRQQLKENLSKSDNPQFWQNEQLSYFDRMSATDAGQGVYNYSGTMLSDYQDINQLALDYGDELNASTITNNTGWNMTADGRWENTKTKVKTNGTPKEVSAYISGLLASNPEAINFLKDRAIANGVTDVEDYIVKEMMRSSALATGAKQFTEVDQTISSRNLSKAQLMGQSLDAMMNNPIFRTSNSFKNPFASDESIDAIFNPDVNINKIVSKSGEAVDLNLLRSELTGKGYDPKLVDNIINNRVNPSQGKVAGGSNVEFIGDMVSALFGGYDADKIKEAEAIQKYIDNNYGVERMSKEEFISARDKILDPIREQYNSSVPENMRINNNDEFAKIHKANLKNTQELFAVTLDYQLPSNDLLSKELSKNKNFTALSNLQFYVVENGKEKQMSTSERQAFINKLNSSDNVRVSQGTRIAQGLHVGGRSYKVGTDDGSYVINVEPLSQNEQEMFGIDNLVLTEIMKPGFNGVGEFVGYVPHPSAGNQGVFVQYAPRKEYKNGILSSGMVARSVKLKVENGQIVYDQQGKPIIDEVLDVKNITPKQFAEYRELDRRSDYKDLYMAEYLNRQFNPFQ